MKTINNYAQLVKAQHALNKSLAPVETDAADASQGYAIGEQFILDGDLCKAKTAIAEHDALVLNTNYELADDITTQLSNKQDPITVDNVPTDNSDNLVKSGGVYSAEANIYAVMGKNGAKNYLRILASGTTTTNGVTFVVNDDGTITVSTDENGATADTNYYLNPASQTWVDPDYPIGDYILSGCPAGGSAGTYRLALSRQGAASVLDTGTGATFTHASGVKALALIQIGTGTVLTTPIVFKPMIRLATDTDNTFQPYAKTNQQLTAENQTLAQNIGDITQLGTTDKSSAVAAINEVNSTLGNKASTTDVNNKHKLTIKTVDTSNWSTDTTSQSGTTLYKKSISLNHVYVESPAVDIATSSGTGLPTTAQQTAYDLLQYVTVDGTTLYLYASAIPATQFYIGVEGVD